MSNTTANSDQNPQSKTTESTADTTVDSSTEDNAASIESNAVPIENDESSIENDASSIESQDPSDNIIHRSATITEELSGKRCDQIAAKLFPEFSRGKLQSWITSGELAADNQQCKPRQKLFIGAQLDLTAEFTPVSDWAPESRPINIVYEDEHLLVVNKPINCVVHPAPGLLSGTLVNSVLAHCPGNSALPRGGIVHRLDKDTTGLMVVAKSLEAHSSLVRQLQQRTVSRVYRAVVKGNFISGGTVDAPIGRHTSVRTKMAVAKISDTSASKAAVTHYRICERFAHHTDLTVKLETGRTHQIRVHMAHIKHPLVGDKTYNTRYQQISGVSTELDETLRQFPRQALHAFQLSFEHPATQELVEFQCDLPDDYTQLVNALRAEDKRPKYEE